jgi:Tetratricopeptide repeat
MTNDKKEEDLVRVYESGEPLQQVVPLIKRLAEAGKAKEAIELLGELAEHHTRLLGPDHRNTLMSRYLLYSLAECAGHKAAAVAEYRKLLVDCERALGPNHPVTHTVRDVLRLANT